MLEFKKWLICHLLLGYIFVTSGLIVNFFMLCSCIIWPFSKSLYRTINRHLAYSHWINLTVWTQWWSKSNVVTKFADGTDHRLFGKEHAIIILNHKYDIDWLMGWILAERVSALGGGKIYAKEVLKYLPLLGWAWYFTESIFLKRDWQKDQRVMLAALKKIPEFPYPVWLLLFCEGTRFTDAKHAQSIEYAKKVGLPLLKHHLVPRTKGFVHSIFALKGKMPALYTCVIGFNKEYAVPTLKSIYCGLTCRAEMHIRRIPLEDIPTDSHESCANWLHKLYQDKDELYDEFDKRGTFPGKTVAIPRHLNDLIVYIFWVIVTCVPLFYFIATIMLSASLGVQLTVIGVMAVGTLVARGMIHMTHVDRGDDYSKKYNSKSQ